MSVLDEHENRQERAAKNQSLFREINERVKDLNHSFSAVTNTSEWICECAVDSCVERVEMSMSEYEAIRAVATRFFVAPSDEHVWPDVEYIIDRTDRYWIVEKLDLAGKLAAQNDPRSNDGAVPILTPMKNQRRGKRSA